MAELRPVTSTDYPYARIRVEIRHTSFRARALVDTGFTGYLVIPLSALTPDLGLPDGRVELEVADGRVASTPVFLGTVEVIGFPPFSARVGALGEEYILGRAAIDRFRVIFDHGERLIIEP